MHSATNSMQLLFNVAVCYEMASLKFAFKLSCGPSTTCITSLHYANGQSNPNIDHRKRGNRFGETI